MDEDGYDDQGFPTPGEAARGDIPASATRLLTEAVRGDEAVVVLGTNEPPRLYPIICMCVREGGLWFEESSFGPGEGLTMSGGAAVTLCEEAPPGVSSVVVEHAGVRHDVPVVAGWFAYASWDVDAPPPRRVG